jgi:hypothetical protein
MSTLQSPQARQKAQRLLTLTTAPPGLYDFSFALTFEQSKHRSMVKSVTPTELGEVDDAVLLTANLIDTR